ncbi:MAG: DUF2341 domain-containing protein [Bacteroidetes bacterium]|nr:DUF2341 domain-containing protein [Bacteroidota bacterium]
MLIKRLGLFIGFFLFIGLSYGQLPGYSFYKILTINAAQVGAGGPFIDFPVLVSRTDLDLRVVASGGDVRNANGYDIKFTAADGITPLDHQLELYVPTTGELVAWVRVPSVAGGTVIRMYYGNTAIVADQSVTTTWNAQYNAVWHLHNDVPSALDATANTHTMTNVGSANLTGATRKIADGQTFVAGNSLTRPPDPTLVIPGNVTLEGWVRMTTIQAGIKENVIFACGGGTETAVDNYSYYFSIDATTLRLRTYWEYGAGTDKDIISTVSSGVATGTWRHIAMVRDVTANSVRFYVNGVLSGAAVAYLGTEDPTGGGSNTFRIAQDPNTTAQDFIGSLDELRISNDAKPAGWLLTNYNTMNTPATFFAVGAEICVNPTTSAAGPDQSICALTTATLAGNAPTVGAGVWSVIAGGATVTTPTSPTSGVTGLALGANTFRWTISNSSGTCVASTDDITITVYANPTASAAGPNQSLCNTPTATLAGNTPIVGTGAWSVIAGSATVTTPTSPTSGVTGLTTGVNTFRWTISNGTCVASTDDITITNYANPTTSAAGPDQAVCGPTATLAGNSPSFGTGVWTVLAGSGIVTTPSSPTSGVTGLSPGVNTFRWTITNGVCAPSIDDITITSDPVPTTAAAGPDQSVCATAVATLAGNAPTTGTGVWTVVTGSATVTTPSSPTSGVTGLSYGTNTFRWTISNGVCAPSVDDIIITRYDVPTIADAGFDQTVCATSATLAGNTPIVGTGVWTVISGGATITTPTSPTSGVTGLSVGVNTFRWTISNGICTPSTDDIIINRLDFPTTAAAGPDQVVCSPNATLAGNTPTVGTGVWTVIAGGATITTPTSPTSGVTGLSIGVNTFRWTITNSTCPSSVDDVTINRDAAPTTANAGTDQTVCATTATLAGNLPAIGTRVWTVIAGTGSVTFPSAPGSPVTGLSVGVNIFRWTISNGVCPPSTDDVTITRLPFPTTSAAGPNQTLCTTTATLAGNSPTVGTGAWTVIAGSATVTTPTSPTSGVTGLSLGVNTFRWTISNSICTPSVDDITIFRDTPPTVAAAGPNQTICASTATLAGNTPTVGTGTWTVIAGSGTVTTPSSPTSGVTGLSIGVNTFRWTISNGTCAPSFDDITINVDQNPTVSNAGADNTFCSASSSLNGNTPILGTGIWTVFSGGGFVTTPSSPTSGVTGLTVGTNTFVWTISNGTCPSSIDSVSLIIDPLPTVANAGFDSTICSTASVLNGNIPIIGSGMWTITAGTGTLTSTTSATPGVSGLSIGANTFVWTISNGTCPPSADNVTITVDPVATISAAGPDQTICSTTATLAANTPLVGTGIWSVIAGSATVTTPSSPTSGVTGLSVGVNTFRWTITSGVCTPSMDDITITRDATPTVSAAGVDQNVCATTATLAANTPLVGTGVWTVITGAATVTTPSSPTSGVTGLSVGVNTFRWTISNGICASSTDDITINRFNIPTTAAAGPDQVRCATTATLAGNTPTVGTGAWTVIAGGATVTTPTSPTSGVTGLSVGVNTFRWTISNGVCTPSTDDVTITRNANPTLSNAGPDQSVCTLTATLAGNTPVVGTGAWTVLAGGATVTTPTSPTSGVTGLSVGVNTFRWTISNGVCTPSTDNITITRFNFPTVATAGPDQTLCVTTATLAGNTPTVGTGAWTVIAGTGVVTTPISPTSGVTGLSFGVNTFRWTISNGVCTPTTDDITIFRDTPPTTSAAGVDQTVCATSATLAGNNPVVGTGAWTVITGSGVVTTPSSPSSGVTGLSVGVNTFRWTISNGTCSPSIDDVIINRLDFPTAAAGPDQTICATTAILAANTPIIGTGAWTVIAGTGVVTTPTSPTSGVTGLSLGVNTFRWTISNGVCTPSTDDITIFQDTPPTTSNAGTDQTVCVTTATLNGNAPIVGTGIWTVVAGSATVTTPTSPTSGVTGLSVGINTFRWTTTNGTCPPSIDDITINRLDFPTTAAAGPDQTLCTTTATLAANTPAIGTGAWTVIAGTGVVTTPTSPSPGVTGLSLGVNTFRWTISNGICTPSIDDVTIFRDTPPTTSNAGVDQTVCTTTATLAGNAPTVGTGFWTVVTGTGVVTTPTSPTSGVTGLSFGTNTFRWTISNGTCAPSVDDIVIDRLLFPTTAAAGPDQTLCTTTATLAGNNPIVGTGVWTVIAGTGVVTTPTSPSSGVTGLSFGANIFRWTISNGVCTPSIDDITIFRDTPPTVSNAGIDQTVCLTSATLAGNTPVVGAGTWTVVTGSATVTTPSSPSSGVTGLSVGVNTFVWTISNGTCANSFDSITINRLDFPTPAAAGPDQIVCSDTATLAANTPIVGSGFWTVIAGSGVFSTPTSPTSGVTGMILGANTFRWTTSNGLCTPSTDDITINRLVTPTVALAGPDQTICSTTATLTGNTPVIGSGAWTVIAGTGIVTTPTSATSGVTGISLGFNTFVWTITSGSCPITTDTVVFYRLDFPTVATAGPDQTLCATTATLAANTPIVGTGSWTVIAGTGVVTTPTSPTSGVTGLSFGVNTFRWTISNGVCIPSSDDITIFRDTPPTVAAAGVDQTICATSTTLAGNTPVVGTGLWTIVAGSATITTPTSPTSTLTGLGVGTNIFVWTISNGTCANSFDSVTIFRYDFPTVATAGPDQTLCATTATLAANTPVVGTGAWTVIAGTGVVTTPSSPTSGVTGLSFGVNTFRWTISNGVCTPSTDDITIFRDTPPTVAAAGVDQTICATSTTLAGNTPVVGTGLWTIVAGSATITTPTSPTSTLIGLGVGTNIFVWTISNGTCANSFDSVTIFRFDFPTVATAGPDQTLCATTATLAANTPVVGTGAWTVIAGTGVVTTPTSPTSGVTGLSFGVNTFRWTISNGVCTPSTDDITIFRDTPPTVSNAGVNQTICATSTALAGNTPVVGTGLWTIVAGSATITTPTSPTSTLTGLGVGTNIFVWTISNGTCANSFDSVTIFRYDFPTVATAGPDQTLCATTATLAANTPVVGTGVWSVIAGTGVVTTPSSPTSGVTGLSFGVNVFRWTISNGVCTPSTDDITIFRDTPPTVSNAGVNQTICATSTTLAGNTPVVGTGLWTIVAGSATITTPTSPTSGLTGLGVGTNIFVWTISNGTCAASVDSVTIFRFNFPTLSAAGPNQTVCSTTATLAGNTPIVGTGVWTVLAGTGVVTTPTSPTSGVTGLSVGINTFRWTISNGVCSPSTDDITITRDAPPTVSAAGIDQTICATSATLAGNTPAIGTGLWTVITGTGVVTTPSSPTSTVSGISVGVNTFVWTISNGVCPSSTDTVTIYRFDFPTIANAGFDSTICSSASTLNANAPIVGTGIWSVISGTGTVTSPTSNSSTVTGMSIGVNKFVWTISNGVCLSSKDTVTINVDAYPTIANAGSDFIICASSATLNGNTPIVGTGLWTIVSGSGTITNPTSPTSSITGVSVGVNVFVWTISNGTCVPTTDTVVATINTFATPANAGSDSTICSSFSSLNGNIPIVGIGTWSVIAGTGILSDSSNVTSGISGLSIGTNTFVWSITSGACPVSHDTVNYFVDPLPTVANAGFDSTICSANSTLNGNTPAIGSGTWTVTAGGASLFAATSPSCGVSGLSVGVNTFVWTIANGTCPSSFDTVSIFVDPFPTAANAGFDSTICSSTSSLNGNVPTIGTGNWSVVSGAGTITTPSSPTTAISGLSIGTNTFVWTISNGTCSASTDTVNYYIDPFPSAANAGFDSTICAATSTLNGNTPAIGTGLWTAIVGTGTLTSPSSPICGITGMSSGINTFVWTISSGTCPSTTDTVTIFVDAFPTVANAGIDSAICAFSSTLNGNVPIVGTGFWTLISGSGTIVSPASPVTSVTGLSIGSNIFRWTISGATCPPTMDDVEIWVDDIPTIANAGLDVSTSLNFVTLNANTPITGIGTWSILSGSGLFTNINDPGTYTANLTGGQNIFLWTISNGACPSSTDEVMITVSEIQVPNGFSPNGDNINDFFEIPGLGDFTNVELNVFNRWGNLVYSNPDYKNDWDGNNNSGGRLSDDTYYYILKLSAERTINGYVVIKTK